MAGGILLNEVIVHKMKKYRRRFSPPGRPLGPRRALWPDWSRGKEMAPVPDDSRRLQDSKKRFYHRWIELDAAVPLDLLHGSSRTLCRPIGTVGRQRLIRVGNSDNPRSQGDLIRCQSARVAPPVPVFVAVTDGQLNPIRNRDRVKNLKPE